MLSKVDCCCISPGIPMRAPFVALLLEKQIPIWSEIELAYRYSKGKLAAITGTNGKTTTTALTGEILGEWFESSFVVEISEMLIQRKRFTQRKRV